MAAFGYRGKKGPQYWGSLCEEYRLSDTGVRQSPIDIATSSVVYNDDMAPIRFQWTDDDCVLVENNGKAPTYFVSPESHYIQGGTLHGRYELVQFHIHFSNTIGQGSEHSINGQFYPAEVHFVHYKTSYGSLQEALKHPDGLAVVGAFIDIDEDGDSVNGAFEKDIRQLAGVTHAGSFTKRPAHLTRYHLHGKKFYTYDGSLTTPGCCECVIWFLLKDVINISPEAYQIMTSLQSSEGGLICDPGNFRPVQPLNGRQVSASFIPELEA